MRRKNNESGMILPLVIILALALTITGMAFLSSTVMEHNLAMREVHKTQAFYLAEGGVEDARFKLGQDWELVEDYNGGPKESPPIIGALGAGTYNVTIYNTESDNVTGLSSDRRRVNSTGIVKEVSQIVQVIVRQAPSGDAIKAALETKGEVRVRGNATIRGDLEKNIDAIIAKDVDPLGNYTIEPEDGINISPECTIETPYLGCFADFFPPYPYQDYFEYVFKVTKEKMKRITQASPNNYYDHYIQTDNELHADHITWIDGQEGQSQITSAGWNGEGILIVNGDLKMTGGTFNGIIWVIGSLELGAGYPVINGAIVVESDITETIPLQGTLEVNYDREKIDLAVDKIATIPFIELGTWEQLK